MDLKRVELTDNAMAVLKGKEERYLKGDETPEDRFFAMCLHVAQAEDGPPPHKTFWAEKFYNELIQPLCFLPNSPTLVNSGRQGGLQACVVVSPQDTLESIYQTVKEWALIEKFGSGVGGYFGDIREKGSKISTTHGQALGPIAILEILSLSQAKVTQGSFREGAHMAVLPISHPDIREFIHCKDQCKLPTDMLANFNISVQVPDTFMRMVHESAGSLIALVSPKDNSIVGYASVEELWAEICESAWKTGDPGLIFIDRIRETEPNPQLGLIQGTNPCGEEPLENYGSCNLGSINLSNHVLPHGSVDWNKLATTIKLAVRFLDDVITVNVFPEDVPQLQEINLKTRRIGLGVMGWADMLVKLGIPYDSEEAADLARELSAFITRIAWEASLALGAKRGSFPEWPLSKLSQLHPEWAEWGSGPRNSSVTTIAPTGSISIIAGCSSGIEPYFALSWERKTLWKEGAPQQIIREMPAPLRARLETQLGVARVDTALNMIAEKGNLFLRSYIQDKHGLFKDAHEISPEWHIKHQSAWQEHVTSGISKTINIPEGATPADIGSAFLQAWETGCKAITVYRDHSKDVQIIEPTKIATRDQVKDVYSEGLATGTQLMSQWETRPRPREIPGVTYKIKTGHGNLYVVVNKVQEDEQPFEVFCTLGKAGGCDSAQIEAITRLISLALRSGLAIESIVRQLQGISCCPSWDNGKLIRSTPDGIAKVLSLYSVAEESQIGASTPQPVAKLICPKCSGINMIYQEGCYQCQDCGWSRCE